MPSKALVIGAETFSRILDWEDRATCVLFGDGAGALVLSAEEGERGILATKLHADGRHNDLLFVDGGPSTTGTVGKLRMKGREVFRHAVVNLAEVLNEVLDDAGLTSADVDWVVPHQANARILDATAKKLGLPPEKVVVTVDRACQHLGGLGPACVRHRGQGRANQARRHRRAGSDGRWLYMGRGSAQVLKNLEYPAKCRIADTTEFRYESVIETAGGAVDGGRIFDGRSRDRADQ